MYAERPSTVPGAVLWRSSVDGTGRVLPDGCMDLIWMRGELVVAGPDTGPYEHAGTPGSRYVGLRFAPGALPELLRVPARDLLDTRVPLSELLDDRGERTLVDRLTDRLAETAVPGRVLESFPAAYARARAAPRIGPVGPAGFRDSTPVDETRIAGQPDPLIAEVARLLATGTPVGEVAERVHLGVRQLHRLSLSRFGYGPKTLGSILRFQRALRLIPIEPSVAVLARRAGYADQAHLIRETRRLAGAPFGSLIGR